MVVTSSTANQISYLSEVTLPFDLVKPALRNRYTKATNSIPDNVKIRIKREGVDATVPLGVRGLSS